MTGERHPYWKGSAASDAAIHFWLKRHLVKSGRCSQCGREPEPTSYLRDGKRVSRVGTDWANVSGEYQRTSSDWIELCRSCHAKMDDFAKNFGT